MTAQGGSRRLRRGAAALVVGAVAMVVVAPAAVAAPEGRIVQVTTGGGKLNVVFSASGLADGQSLDPNSVSMVVEGVQIDAKAKPAGETKEARTAVLTMDTSGSMQGAPLASAKQAAATFVNSVPADVRVGLVTFADNAVVRVNPTTNHQLVLNAVNALAASGSTALYDATVLATKTVGTSGARSIVVLSDGKDEGSKATLNQAKAAVSSSGAVLDAVSIGTDSNQTGPLQTLTNAGRGQLFATNDINALSAAFSSSAREIANQVVINATIPTALAGTSGNLTVNAQAGGTAVSDSVFVSVDKAAPATNAVTDYGPKQVVAENGVGSGTSKWLLPIAIFLLFIGLLVILGTAFASADRAASAPDRMTRRLSIYTLTGRKAIVEQQTTTALGSSGVARSAVELADRMVAKREFETVLAQRLEAAAVPLRPAEWTLIHVGITIGGGLLLLLLFGGRPIPAIIGLVFGFIGPWLYLSIKESRRRSAFLTQLPDTLQLIAGSLSSGYSLPQAVDAVVGEAQQPISTEFNRALVETRLGVPLEDALDSIAARMQSVDFAWVVMAIRIQREVGGNLAEILTTVAATLRERERLRRQVEVLSAEGRLSAWILGLLPVMFTLYLILARPEYLKPLYTTLLGGILIFMGVLLMIVGILWLRKTVKVEV